MSDEKIFIYHMDVSTGIIYLVLGEQRSAVTHLEEMRL